MGTKKDMPEPARQAASGALDCIWHAEMKLLELQRENHRRLAGGLGFDGDASLRATDARDYLVLASDCLLACREPAPAGRTGGLPPGHRRALGVALECVRKACGHVSRIEALPSLDAGMGRSAGEARAFLLLAEGSIVRALGLRARPAQTAGQEASWRGLARQGEARQGAGRGEAWPGEPGQCRAWLGMAWSRDKARLGGGRARLGKAVQDSAGQGRGLARLAWARLGGAWRRWAGTAGRAGRSLARLCWARQSVAGSWGEARHCVARLGKPWQGMAWHGSGPGGARPGAERQGTALQG